MGSEISSAVNSWYRTERRDLPWRREGFSAWGTLVSEFMLQQTPVSRVISRLDEWLTRWPTPGDLASVPPGEAVRAWKSLGYPRRALRLHEAATTIAHDYDGVVPSDVEVLLTLPGVGDYTARAVAVFAYGVRHPVVDTNTRRVIARACNGEGEAPPATTKRELAAMSALLPEEAREAAEFNAGMMELGAIVCTARSPRCGECPLRNQCAWRSSGYPPYAGPRRAVQKKYEGSDRQVRGLILAELRALHRPMSAIEVEKIWPDQTQRERALSGLIRDGLASRGPDGYSLP